MVFLTRLSPIFPFVWLNYFLGLTAVRTGAYVLATFIGMLPAMVLVRLHWRGGARRACRRTESQFRFLSAGINIRRLGGDLRRRCLRHTDGA